MTHSISKLIAGAVFLGALTAAAQPYPINQSSQPYSSLSGAGVTTAVLTAQSMFGGSPNDDGFVNIPLGFNFPYYGVNYTTVHVDSNGFLMFGGAGQCELDACYGGDQMPST